jgi:hypothetical protein
MPHFFVGVNVLEYGPHNRSKKIKGLYEDSRYAVIDPRSSDLEEIKDGSFKVVISVNNFNFTNNYLDQLKSMHRVSSKFVMFSCLAAGYGDVGQEANLTEGDFYGHLDMDSMFESLRFHADYSDHMLYFWGVKRSEV